ncbi:restriction endonuclease subunit S [Bdellovibrio sp. HCB337]|uniref:restriction endonuclease subunit S n=1 Tax=Bdellovibrio sp. HCB337 TaxID=3394358 RepID=UPI0039A5200A
MMPSGWELVPASTVCEAVIDCKNRTPPFVEKSEFAVVRTPNVRNGRFVCNELKYTDEDSFKIWTQRGVPTAGDVLITREAPLGEVCLVPPQMKVCLGQRMMLYRPDQKKIKSEYLLQALMSEDVQKRLKRGSDGSTVGHAKVGQIRDLLILLPPKAEQEKIAKILSTWDEAIEKLEAYFIKRRQLLAHQVEVIYSQIKKDGKEADLKGVCSYIQDGTHSTPNYTKEGIPFYSVETLVSNDFNKTKYISRKDHEINIKRCRPEKGDLLLTRIGSLGVSKLIDWDIEASIYVSLALLKPNLDLVDSAYLYFYFQTREFNRELLKRSLLNAAPQKINLSEIGNIPVWLPKNEATQEAAGKYVMEMKAEVELLKKRIDKLKLQKQGLMQQLLMGKKRVKV